MKDKADTHALEALAPNARYLTTKEVADLLRVKERKVYDLVGAGEIPHRRVTGKLLFVRSEILAWIEGDGAHGARPDIVSGSHDPLLEWAVRESGSGLATLFDGSIDGLDRFAAGDAAMTGLHVPGDDGWNISTVAERSFAGVVLINWAQRSRGLILAAELEGAVQSLSDLKGRRMARRQPGAGTAKIFERLCAEAGVAADDIQTTDHCARTELDAAAAVAAGEADAALGVEAMARQFKLPFAPLMQERFDLLIDRRSYFTLPLQRLMTFVRSNAFRDKAAAMGGYDLSEIGAVRWISP